MIAVPGWFCPDRPADPRDKWIWWDCETHDAEPPPSAPLNRHERRRQAAMERPRAYLAGRAEG